MADRVPLNSFKTVATTLTSISDTLYTTPTGKTTIVLGALASNVTNPSATVTVSFLLRKNSEDFILLNNFPVPPNDAADLITTGKLILEEGISLKAVAGSNNSISLVLSLLETSNE